MTTRRLMMPSHTQMKGTTMPTTLKTIFDNLRALAKTAPPTVRKPVRECVSNAEIAYYLDERAGVAASIRAAMGLLRDAGVDVSGVLPR